MALISKVTLIFIVLQFVVYSAISQYNCEDFANESTRNVTIDEKFDGVIESLYISDIEGAEIQGSSFLEAKVDNQKYLTIFTSKSIAEYDVDDHIKANLVIDCADNDYKVDYSVYLTKTVCNGLEFNQLSYTYVFYDSLPSQYEFDLNDFESIFVTCSESTVTFNIQENAYFSIENGESSTLGHYRATLKVKDYLEAPFDKVFNITAQDDANPSSIVSATLRIEIIDAEFIGFREQFYYGVIRENGDIVINNGPILLDTGIDNDDILVDVVSDYSDFFEVELVFDTVNLYISPQRDLHELNDTSILLTLKAHDRDYEITVETTVVLNISLPAENPSYEDMFTDPPVKIEDEPTSLLSNLDEESTTLVSQEGDGNEDTIDDNYEDEASQEQAEAVESTTTTSEEDDGNKGDDDYNQDYEDDNVHVIPDYNDEASKDSEVLRGFRLWVSHTKAMIMMITVLSIFTILSGIIYIRNRTPSPSRVNYEYHSY